MFKVKLLLLLMTSQLQKVNLYENDNGYRMLVHKILLDTYLRDFYESWYRIWKITQNYSHFSLSLTLWRHNNVVTMFIRDILVGLKIPCDYDVHWQNLLHSDYC